MAFSSPRGGLAISRRVLRQCKSLPLQPFAPTTAAARSFSGSLARHQEASAEDRIAADPAEDAVKAAPGNVSERDLPRWAHTPDRMKAPFSLAIPRDTDPARSWTVNEDPELLDRFYDRFLGREGHRLLPDDLKWLAVTHKSFDQGRRGFNTRLAQFGRSILVMEAIRYIMAAPVSAAPIAEPEGARKPFEHPALVQVDNLTTMQPLSLLSKQKITKLAYGYGMQKVVRWVPRDTRRLHNSGLDVVLHSSLYAILGAVSLQNGAAVASRISRERVLSRLDIEGEEDV